MLEESGYEPPWMLDRNIPDLISGHCIVSPGRIAVKKDIMIPAGSVLEISPGARLEFAPGVGIRCTGRIVAAGDKGQRIIFEGQSWAGILMFGREVHGTVFQHCVFAGGTGSQLERGDNPLIGLVLPDNMKHDDPSDISRGGALHLVATTQASISIENCIFECNRLEGNGFGGAVCCHKSDPEFRHCLFERNETSYFGGAIHCNKCSPEILSCRFRKNSAGNGGAIGIQNADPVIEDCQFVRNRALSIYGAAVYCSGSENTVLRKNTYQDKQPLDVYGLPEQ